MQKIGNTPIDFEELDSSEGCQLLKHNTGHMDTTEKGTYTFYYRPKQDIRKKLHEMSTNPYTSVIFQAKKERG